MKRSNSLGSSPQVLTVREGSEYIYAYDRLWRQRNSRSASRRSNGNLLGTPLSRASAMERTISDCALQILILSAASSDGTLGSPVGSDRTEGFGGDSITTVGAELGAWLSVSSASRISPMNMPTVQRAHCGTEENSRNGTM